MHKDSPRQYRPSPGKRSSVRREIWSTIKYYAVGLWNYVDEDHCFLLASGIAFNVLYCILPLSLVIFYFLSATLTSEKAISYVLSYISESFPLPVYEDDLKAWLATKLAGVGNESKVAGIVGGISLFWLASILFSTLRTSLNAVLNLAPKSNAIMQKVLDFLLMILILVLLLSSTFLEPIASLLQRIGTRILPAWLELLLNTTIPYIVSLGLSVLLYVLLFRMLPHQRLSRKVIFVSATTTVVLTEAMRRLFAYYITSLSSIGALYGSFAFLVGTSLWVYYASLAFLIGAEVGWLYKERNEIAVQPVPKPSRHQIAQAKHPGIHAPEQTALKDYESIKHNPTRAAGELKPPPDEEGNTLQDPKPQG